MGDPLAYLHANFAAIIVESVFFGLFLVIGVTSLYLVISRANHVHSKTPVFLSPMFLGATSLLLFVTGVRFLLSLLDNIILSKPTALGSRLQTFI